VNTEEKQMKRFSFALIVVAALGATACLQKDTTSTIYLNPDGSVDWVVLEQNVRSDAGDGTERAAEEGAYLTALAEDRHAVAESFRALGGRDVRTQRIRESRPWMTLVSAHFEDLGAMWSPLLSACGIPHGTRTTSQGGITTWDFWADLGPDIVGAAPDHCADPLEGLLDATDGAIVLTAGHFEQAVGLVLGGPDRATLPDSVTDEETLAKTGGRLVLSLSWKNGG
jgi:hypothetical protein